ncbi:hypothetical protein, partial [Klebsiella pneumoniae]|uniref:hypothetical protein n=1 Tax=Klebsiella pneumoniae TaxID=573 RepID=UPI001D0EB2CA
FYISADFTLACAWDHLLYRGRGGCPGTAKVYPAFNANDIHLKITGEDTFIYAINPARRATTGRAAASR